VHVPRGSAWAGLLYKFESGGQLVKRVKMVQESREEFFDWRVKEVLPSVTSIKEVITKVHEGGG
jgi:hypothetical protein